MLAQLVQDLVHLEGCEDRLDQDRRADAAAGDAERRLRVDEHLVPQARLAVRLELGEVQVRPAPALERRRARMEQVHPEVEQRRRDRHAIDQDMRFDEVPATRPDEQGGAALVEPIGLALGRVEGEDAARRVGDRCLATDDVGPRRGQGVLEVGHEDTCPRIEGVDHHLGLGRARDLDPPVLEVGRGGRHLPLGILSDVVRRHEEPWANAGVELRLALLAPTEKVEPDRPEASLEIRHEGQGLVGQDAISDRYGGATDVDPGWCHSDAPR